MARVCQVTGKRQRSGNRVSHSNAHSRRVQRPNVQRRRIWVPSLGRFVRAAVSAAALRTLDRRGGDWLLACQQAGR